MGVRVSLEHVPVERKSSKEAHLQSKINPRLNATLLPVHVPIVHKTRPRDTRILGLLTEIAFWLAILLLPETTPSIHFLGCTVGKIR